MLGIYAFADFRTDMTLGTTVLPPKDSQHCRMLPFLKKGIKYRKSTMFRAQVGSSTGTEVIFGQ